MTNIKIIVFPDYLARPAEFAIDLVSLTYETPRVGDVNKLFIPSTAFEHDFHRNRGQHFSPEKLVETSEKIPS